jgi:PAS domain S-box-containing protein
MIMLVRYFSRLQNQREQLYSAKNELSEINSSLEDKIVQRTSELKKEVVEKQLIATDLLNQKTILQSILETSPDLIFMKDSSLRYIAINSAFADSVGVSKEQIIGKTDNELFNDNLTKSIKNIDYQIQTSKKPKRFEQELTFPDGSKKIYDFIIVPYNNSENLSGILGLARDVTELSEQNQTMKKFKAAIDKSFSNVIITDKFAHIEFVNKGYTNLTGYSLEEVLGKTPSIINSKYHDRTFYDNLWNTILSGKEWSGEFRNISKNGNYFWELASIIPIENSLGEITHFVKVSQDVTSLKKTEEDLQKAKEVAEAANNAKSMFLANMSHEIRTPLNTIIGFSRLIYQLSESDNVLKNYSEAIQSSGKTLLSIINDVLDLAKIEAGKIEVRLGEMNLKNFIDEISLNYGILLSNKVGLDFSVSIESEIPMMIFTDEFRLKQIINNLMSNAIKFTHKGYIILAVWHNMIDEDLFDLHFEVRDSGIGIPESDKERIFKSFEQSQFQNYNKYGGSGLGMTISQELATLLNGFISFTSEENVGSNFKLTLKSLNSISEGDSMRKDTIINKRQKIQFKPSKILIADDVEYNILLIYESLKEYPFEFYLARNGQEAIDMVTTFNPDIILMDIRMPEVDGIESSRQIRLLKGFENIPIICITASAIRIDELELTNFFNEVIYKPIDQFQLERVLSHYIEHTKLDEVEEYDNKEVELSMFVDTIEDKVDLKKIFESEILKKWEEALNSPFMEPSVVFGNLVKSIGEEFKVPFFEKYGQHVVNHAESYNLPELKKELHNFESVVTFIQKIT